MSWRGMVVMVVVMPHTGLVLGLLGGRGGMQRLLCRRWAWRRLHLLEAGARLYPSTFSRVFKELIFFFFSPINVAMTFEDEAP
jgi:hypothetical protein